MNNDTIQDQPPPTVREDADAVWPMVIDDVRALCAGNGLLGIVLGDMRQRDRIGRERYGTPLQAKNGRRADIDAYQEALDLCAYLRQGIAEGRALEELYEMAIQLVFRLRAYIVKREIEAQKEASRG